MALFQKAPTTPEEVEQSKPLEIPPEKVATFDEKEWYERAYRGDSAQLTWRAVLMGSGLGFLLSFTNIYIGLKTGWALGVALTACIVSYSVWTTFVKIGLAKSQMSILESNCMQSTASSAGYATGNSLVAMFPALLLLSITEANPGGVQFRWYIIAPWVLFSAVCGVAMAIPMKRNMINQEKLTFPSGTAAAVTLQSLYSKGQEALAKAKALFYAALFGAAIPILKDLAIVKKPDPETGKMVRDTIMPGQSAIFDFLPGIHAKQLDPKTGVFTEKLFKLSDWNLRLDHAVALFAAGAIIGIRVTASMMLGVVLLTWVIGPHAMEWSWTNAVGKLVAATMKPSSAWREIGVWYGAPLMVAYGLVTFAFQWRTIGRAFARMGKRSDGESADVAARVEVPTAWFIVGMAIAGTGIVIMAWRVFEIPLHYGALAVFMTFVLSLVACRATGESDITPGGPLGKIMQLTYGVLMPQSYTANLATAGITSGVGLASADLLNDLKSGYLLGANPRRQFVAQLLGVFAGTVASVIGYFVLVPDATAITGVGDKAPAFPAPAAQQWKVVADLFKVGIGNLHPMARQGIAVGLLVGTVLAIAEALFPKQKKWMPSATGLGLGMVFPAFFALSFFLGAVSAWVFRLASKKQAERFIVPISSGLIAGESIIGVLVAALNNFVLPKLG
jgi:uncharacterized oligopeptide transporter (OPT) family protein